MGFNFTDSLQSECVDEAFLLFGGWSNMSGYTSNITQYTSAVYLATSAGPAAFGEMATTYFNIELCQFMFFHQGVTQDNPEVSSFIESLNFMSMSSSDSSDSSDSSGNETAARRLLARRFLATGSTRSFLEINVPIFAFMGASLLAYLIVYLLHRNMDGLCLSCPRIQFYTQEICSFMLKRFKWIYFDFIAWMSYLPFLYFSLLQVQQFSFSSPLSAFSCIFALAVLLTYPLYPLFIAYQVKQNYRDICLEGNTLVEMAFSPWLYKVKRPETVPQDDRFIYCSKDNWRLMYYPLKYFRKFLYVLVLAVCPQPITTLAILIGLNVLFIVYMAVLRPRVMPFMAFDFIFEGVLLTFEVFILIYITLNPVKINIMSIVAHSVGFIMANLSIILAIVLNLVAYYKIIMCLKDLYTHLKEKAEEKDKSKDKPKF